MKFSMGKLIVTPGVSELQNQINIYRLFSLADQFHNEFGYFIVFKPHGTITLVEDGNGNRIDTLGMTIPKQLFCIRNEYDVNKHITTLLLPEEY